MTPLLQPTELQRDTPSLLEQCLSADESGG
jgi:hypothetical protein